MAMPDQQIEEYALEAACGHFLCNADIAAIDQLEALRGSEFKIPDGVVPWEEYENTSAPDLVERIECLRDGFVRAMKLARDYNPGNEDGDLADHDQFECAKCKNVFDNDDSIQMQGELYCTSCAATVFGYSTATTQKVPCPGCGLPVTMPANWQGPEEEAICNQCHSREGGRDNDLAKPCPHCKADLNAPEAVERHYINKDASEDAGEETDAIGYGHYDHEGTFEPDRPADLSGGRYDLMDDSDRCATCSGRL